MSKGIKKPPILLFTNIHSRSEHVHEQMHQILCRLQSHWLFLWITLQHSHELEVPLKRGGQIRQIFSCHPWNNPPQCGHTPCYRCCLEERTLCFHLQDQNESHLVPYSFISCVAGTTAVGNGMHDHASMLWKKKKRVSIISWQLSAAQRLFPHHSISYLFIVQ